MIAIVDYGLGNLGSFANMFKKLGIPAHVTRERSEIEAADRLILPGVGSFDHGISQLQSLNLFELLDSQVRIEKKPILGICLGAQLMTRGSQEGVKRGFGWVAADTVAFDKQRFPQGLRIPHMGWNRVFATKASCVFEEMYDVPRYYFVHSYHFVCDFNEDVLTTTEYGYSFTSAFERENVTGVQFHPEKSHKFGMKLLENFSRAC